MRWTQEDLDDYRRRVQNSPPGAVVLMPRGMRPSDVRTIPSAIPKAKKPAKYNNVKVTDAAGNVHDSGKEFRHWQELELRERAGEIQSLRRQVPFALVVAGVLVCQYIADFVYVAGSSTVVVDAKSPPTRAKAEYRIKLKLMQALHGIQIREV